MKESQTLRNSGRRAVEVVAAVHGDERYFRVESSRFRSWTSRTQAVVLPGTESPPAPKRPRLKLSELQGRRR